MNLQNKVMKLKYQNFFWVVTWVITKVCNLRCSYCDKGTPDTEHPDFEIGMKHLLKMKPKELCINGGEPTLVPDFVNILKWLKSDVNPDMHIAINTNGTLPKRVFAILPYTNILFLSIDGVGEVNEWQRGYNGDKLLALLEDLVKYKPIDAQRFSIIIVPVATQLSYPRLPELIDRVENIWKKGHVPVSIDIKPVHPYYHPMSIASKGNFWQDFVEQSREWIERYDLPVSVRGLACSNVLDRKGVRQTSHCIRQFFSAMVEWDGHVMTCKPERYYEWFYRDYINGDWITKAKAMWEGFDSLLLHRYDPTCYSPCDHAVHLDNILSSRKYSEIAERVKKYGFYISKEELKRACLFIKKYFNKDFVLDFEALEILPEPPCNPLAKSVL